MEKEYRNLVEMMEDCCTKYSDQEMYGTKKGEEYEWIKFSEFAKEVAILRGGLSSLGITKEDRVAIIAKNTLEWVVLAYATYSLGAQYIPMYETQRPEDWQYIVKDSGTKVLFVDTMKNYNKIKDWTNKLPKLKQIVLLEAEAESLLDYKKIAATWL